MKDLILKTFISVLSYNVLQSEEHFFKISKRRVNQREFSQCWGFYDLGDCQYSVLRIVAKRKTVKAE